MEKILEDTYLVGDSIVLSKDEATKWILSHRLDAVIVHEKNGWEYVCVPGLIIAFRNIKMHETISCRH